jgi:hypothetical protein
MSAVPGMVFKLIESPSPAGALSTRPTWSRSCALKGDAFLAEQHAQALGADVVDHPLSPRSGRR